MSTECISFLTLESNRLFHSCLHSKKLYPPVLVTFISLLVNGSYKLQLPNSSILISICSALCAVIFPGNREWKAGKASRCDSRQIQCHMELSASQGQQPWVLPWSGGPQELLLLQGCPEGWIHCWQPLHAWELCNNWLPWCSPSGRHPNESQLLQYSKQTLTTTVFFSFLYGSVRSYRFLCSLIASFLIDLLVVFGCRAVYCMLTMLFLVQVWSSLFLKVWTNCDVPVCVAICADTLCMLARQYVWASIRK